MTKTVIILSTECRLSSFFFVFFLFPVIKFGIFTWELGVINLAKVGYTAYTTVQLSIIKIKKAMSKVLNKGPFLHIVLGRIVDAPPQQQTISSPIHIKINKEKQAPSPIQL
jgi:hypothetical protein